MLKDTDVAWRNATLAGYQDALNTYKTSSMTVLHYVTVIGISGDGKRIRFLDSSGYTGAKEKPIEEFLQFCPYFHQLYI